jgi:hypothetical protein
MVKTRSGQESSISDSKKSISSAGKSIKKEINHLDDNIKVKSSTNKK